ncbi:MAG: hypothetical protein M1616_00930 [Candidatus Thermoplasmatota archaeon]|jgi:hypothetical protein|nr:hypothetical protein [Candidatus Thermoplasmatota archaeon]
MGPLWAANLVVIVAALIILATLLFSYLRSYARLKTRALGNIVILSGILMADSIVALAVYYDLSLKYGSWLASVLLAINSISLLGYIFLYRSLNL